MLAASGVHVHGEADFVTGLGPASVLDAGCGTGRVAIELARRGVEVVGVDADPSMVATALRLAPDLTWVTSDLADLDLGRRFDVVVLAGNVPLFDPAGHPTRGWWRGAPGTYGRAATWWPASSWAAATPPGSTPPTPPPPGWWPPGTAVDLGTATPSPATARTWWPSTGPRAEPALGDRSAVEEALELVVGAGGRVVSEVLHPALGPLVRRGVHHLAWNGLHHVVGRHRRAVVDPTGKGRLEDRGQPLRLSRRRPLGPARRIRAAPRSRTARSTP